MFPLRSAPLLLLLLAAPADGGEPRGTPAREAPAPVRIAFGGDLAGQNVCRDRERGSPIFHAIRDFDPDLFLALDPR